MRLRDRVGLALGSLVLVLGLFIGVDLVLDPAQCDGHAMTDADRCVGSFRNQRLVVGGDLSNLEPGRSLQSQIETNRVMGGLFAGAGILFAVGGSWVAWGWIQDRLPVRRFRRRTDPRAP